MKQIIVISYIVSILYTILVKVNKIKYFQRKLSIQKDWKYAGEGGNWGFLEICPMKHRNTNYFDFSIILFLKK